MQRLLESRMLLRWRQGFFREFPYFPPHDYLEAEQQWFPYRDPPDLLALSDRWERRVSPDPKVSLERRDSRDSRDPPDLPDSREIG